MLDAIRVLMTQIIDYAGLFPPTSLDMRQTVQNWHRYRQTDHAWMLGRLIIPAGKLEEFGAVVDELQVAPGLGEEPWKLSVLVGQQGLDAQIDRIFEFNRARAAEGEEGDAPPSATTESAPGGELTLPGDQGGIVADAIELKISGPAEIDRAMRIIPEQLEPFFEVPVSVDVRGMLTSIVGTGARAKIRTGSVVSEEIPTPDQVARFIIACAHADVAFKATAGLHHPLRAEYPLTYDDESPCGVMFGFLNVFLASAMTLVHQLDERTLASLLDERDLAAFSFDESGVGWRDKRIDLPQLARVRETFATSFGSCSFEEPVADLGQLKLLA